jgi:hypothetical protein
MSQLVEINQEGRREDLADFISTADVKERPLLAMIPKGKELTNMLMEWQADKYDTPNLDGIADGVDVGEFENAAKDRSRIKNYCQKVRRTAMVGDIAENVSNVAGAKSGEMARSVMKKTEELSRDIEAILGSDNDAQEEVSKMVPYKTRGLGSWIKASAGSVLAVPAAYLTPSASINSTAMASLEETAHFRPVLKSVFEQRGKSQNLTLVCGTALKEAITNFTQFRGGSTNTYGTIRTYNDKLDGKKITNSITAYEGDFNTVVIVPSLLLAQGTSNAPTRRGYLLDFEFLQLRWNRMPRVKPLPDQGGGPRALVDAIFGLCYKNPLIGGKFAATS